MTNLTIFCAWFSAFRARNDISGQNCATLVNEDGDAATRDIEGGLAYVQEAKVCVAKSEVRPVEAA